MFERNWFVKSTISMVLIIPWILIMLWKEVQMLPNTVADDVSVNDLSFCEEGWKRFDQYCFKHVERRLAWNDASSECNNMGGHLASIHSNEQNDFMVDLTAESDYVVCYIGFSSHDFDGIFTWDDGTVVDYTNWGSGQPIQFLKEKCVVFQTLKFSKLLHGLWGVTACSILGTFLCQKKVAISTITSTATDNESTSTIVVYGTSEEIYSCEEGWKRYDQYCYKRQNNNVKDNLNWTDASIKCNSLGGQLASIHSKEQNDFLKDICGRTNDYFGCWIGLYDHDVENKFAWRDETDVDYTNWRPGEPKGIYPDGKCVGLVSSNYTRLTNFGSWVVLRCNITRSVLCQKKISTSTIASTDISSKTTASPNTSRDLDDATGFISVKVYVITIIMIIVFMILMGGILYCKRHWLEEKRSRLSTVFFKRDERVTDPSTQIILEPN